MARQKKGRKASKHNETQQQSGKGAAKERAEDRPSEKGKHQLGGMRQTRRQAPAWGHMPAIKASANLKEKVCDRIRTVKTQHIYKRETQHIYTYTDDALRTQTTMRYKSHTNIYGSSGVLLRLAKARGNPVRAVRGHPCAIARRRTGPPGVPRPDRRDPYELLDCKAATYNKRSMAAGYRGR